MASLNSDKFKDLCRSIKSCVISRKEKTTVELLRKDYKDIEGEDIPYLEFGFNSVRSLLLSIPDYVKLENINGTDYVFQVDNERTRLISKFVAGQKTSAKSNGKKYRGGRQNIGYNHQPRSSPLNYYYRTRLGPEELSFIVNQVNRSPQGLTRNQLLDCLHQWNRYLNISDQVLDYHLQQISHKIRFKNNLILPWIEEKPTNAHQATTSLSFVPHQVARDCPTTRSNSSSSEKKNIMPAECLSSDDPEEVEEMFVDRGEENNNSHPKTSGSQLEEPNRLLVSDRVRLRVEKLVEEHNDGIWCAELPKLYEAKYNIRLDYTELGFGSVAEFVDHLQDYVLKQPKPRGDFKIYLKKQYQNNNSGHAQKQTIASMYNVYDPSYENKQAVPKTLTLEEKKRLIPDDVLSFDETVGQESVFDLNDGDDVVVCEVFDPSFFWIKKVEQIIPLKKLMEELGDFYKEKYKSYLIPPIILQNGLNVACKYSNMWHRAVVLSVRADGLVNILFYDYGTINLRDANELCFLHRKFSTLPAIAIPCGLYNLVPAFGNRWQRHVVLEFMDMCLDKPSQIEIKSVDKDTNSAMVYLYTDRMYMHQKMIEKRLAVEGDVVSSTIENYFLLLCPNAHHAKIAASTIQTRPANLMKTIQSTSEEEELGSQNRHSKRSSHLRQIMNKSTLVNRGPKILSSLRDKIKNHTDSSSSEEQNMLNNRPQLQAFLPINPKDRKFSDKEPSLHIIFKSSETVVDWDKFNSKEKDKRMDLIPKKRSTIINSTNNNNNNRDKSKLNRLNPNSLDACVQKCNTFYEKSKHNLCWTMGNNGFHYERGSAVASIPLELLQPWKRLPEKVKLVASKEYLEAVQSKLSTTSEDASCLSEDFHDAVPSPESRISPELTKQILTDEQFPSSHDNNYSNSIDSSSPKKKVLIEEISSYDFSSEEIQKNDKKCFNVPVSPKITTSSQISSGDSLKEMLYKLQCTADNLFYGHSNVDSDDVAADCMSQTDFESVSHELVPVAQRIIEEQSDHHSDKTSVANDFDMSDTDDRWDVVGTFKYPSEFFGCPHPMQTQNSAVIIPDIEYDQRSNKLADNEASSILDTSETESTDSPLASVSSNLESDNEANPSHLKVLSSIANVKQVVNKSPETIINNDPEYKPKGRIQLLSKKMQKCRLDSQVD